MRITRILVYEGSIDALRKHFAMRAVVGERALVDGNVQEFFMPGEDFKSLLAADEVFAKQVKDFLDSIVPKEEEGLKDGDLDK